MRWWILAAVVLLWTTRNRVDALMQAIGFVESGGNYAAVGPPVNAGGSRAYGKYQVMDFNIGPWSQRALGRALTPAAFLADPAAQDATARAEIARLLGVYGNPADVASVWFSGRPLLQAGNAADVTGTTVPAYVQAVLARL